MSSTPGGSGGGIAAQASAAIDSFRSVGKWLITAFAAVGTLLLAGIQLTSLGSVTGAHLVVALIGFGVAAIAVIVAIVSLTSLLEPHVSAPDDVAEEADNQQTELGTFVQQRRDMVFPPNVNTAQQLFTEFRQVRAEGDTSQHRLHELRDYLSDLVWWSAYYAAKKRFDNVRLCVGIAAVVVAGGVAAYAWAATTSGTETSTAAVPATPVTVRVVLNNKGSKALADLLSKPCLTAASGKGVSAIALSATTSQTTVILIPTPHVCPSPVKFSLPISEGVAEPIVPVKPAVSPSPSHSSNKSTTPIQH